MILNRKELSRAIAQLEVLLARVHYTDKWGTTPERVVHNLRNPYPGETTSAELILFLLSRGDLDAVVNLSVTDHHGNEICHSIKNVEVPDEDEISQLAETDEFFADLVPGHVLLITTSDLEDDYEDYKSSGEGHLIAPMDKPEARTKVLEIADSK